MAEAKQIKDILDNLTECAICISDVTNHRVLPCQHLFCQNCLEPIVKDDSISCPVCRKICPLRGQTVGTLPRSLLLMNLLDTLCEICKQKSRDIHCSHCGKWMCQPCNQTCRKEVEQKLHRLKDETVESMMKRQQHMKLVCDEMSRVNKGIAEISKNIDTNVELAIEQIRIKQNVVKKDLQVQRSAALEELQSSYNKSFEESTKFADFAERYKVGNNDKFDVLIDLCNQWENCLTASSLSRPAAVVPQRFAVKDIEVECDSDCGVQVRIVIPCLHTEGSIGDGLVQPHDGGNPLLRSLNTKPDTDGDKKGAQRASVSITQSLESGRVNDDTTSAATSDIHSDPSGRSPCVADSHGLQQQIQSPAMHTNPNMTDYSTLSVPRDVFGSIRSYDMNFRNPCYVAVSPVTGNICVTDIDNNRVQVLDEQGRFLLHFGSKGSSAGQFNFLSGGIMGGISVTDYGHIIVADSNNHRVQIFDEYGSFIKILGSEGRCQGQFRLPVGVTVGTTGDIYVCDFGNKRIQVFDGDGRVIRIFSSGNRMDDLMPYDVTVTNNGTVIVADQGRINNGKLNIFSRNGQHMKTIRYAGNNQLKEPVAVTVGVNSNIIVTDVGPDEVYILKQNGEHIKTVGVYGQAPGQFDGPCGVACTRDGRIIVVDRRNNRIQLF